MLDGDEMNLTFWFKKFIDLMLVCNLECISSVVARFFSKRLVCSNLMKYKDKSSLCFADSNNNIQQAENRKLNNSIFLSKVAPLAVQ